MNRDQTAQNPLVTIVMATYKPKAYWLVEQLQSLNRQSYENLELIICDDCPEEPVDEEIFRRNIQNFPFRLTRNSKNLGSNKTFEKLTLEADGKYIAYCDQDDIWEDDKIELLVRRIEATGALLCCSDLSIIDENGDKVADSITKIRKRHIFREGENLAPELVVRNFVTGCAMLMRTDIAKAAVPFEDNMVHDHWLALFSALNGKLSFEPTATVKYRQHGSNQTSVLNGIRTKEGYFRLRILPFNSRLQSLSARFKTDENMRRHLQDVSEWAGARMRYMEKPTLLTAKKLWEGRHYEKKYTYFELVLPFMPRSLFAWIIGLFR